MGLFDFSVGDTSPRKDEIFFRMLSEEAKAIALEHRGIKDEHEADWDVFPMAYAHGQVNELDQSDIDLAALATIGAFASVA